MEHRCGLYKPFLLSAILIFGFLAISCQKEEILRDPAAKLIFSADTVFFDTIFTSLGSATRHFKVYNPYKKSLELSINLAGGENSPYRINVDGVPGRMFNDIVIRGGDSIYLFVEATIDPVDQNTPLVVEDSVVFFTNGNIQDVKLVAWGQDVNIIRGQIFQTGRLTAEKPYLVYNSMLIDSGHVLIVDAGAHLHFHRNSRLYVAGTILAEGDHDNPVIFEGARTETVYRNIPGQWEGIWIMPGSGGNRLINVRIRNAVNGIIADTLTSDASPTLYLANSRIENMTHAGILARGTFIYAYNNLISNCGYFALALTVGGHYTFNHCTIANYWNLSVRRTPSVIIENYYKDISGNIQPRSIWAAFGNTIIHGSMNLEIEFAVSQETGFDVLFNHSLLNYLEEHLSNATFTGCIKGNNPGFVDQKEFNFRLTGSSPAIDAGDPETAMLYPFDHEGRSRPFGDGPDIGAFEWHSDD